MLNNHQAIQFINYEEKPKILGTYYYIGDFKKAYIMSARCNDIEDFLTFVHELRHNNERMCTNKQTHYLYSELGTKYMELRATEYLKQMITKEDYINLRTYLYNKSYNHLRTFLISYEIIEYLVEHKTKIMRIEEQELVEHLKNKNLPVENIKKYITNNLYDIVIYGLAYTYANYINNNIEEKDQISAINNICFNTSCDIEQEHGIPKKAYKLVQNLKDYQKAIK